ncbi:hypothetical protein F383_08675 [Gossypium arboreum]|uniref:Uncharacterized protein n=1 Tax=Gossypium arboreum TaxID=29729 RepID=A0A0B0PBU7_GOSAR|nr:hypothetical protein F383_08675 [Gossypium arboreum]
MVLHENLKSMPTSQTWSSTKSYLRSSHVMTPVFCIILKV